MCLQRGHVDHQRIKDGALIRKSEKHLREGAFRAPLFPRAVKGFVGPYSADVSRHRTPFRAMKIMRLNTRLSSTRGLP